MNYPTLTPLALDIKDYSPVFTDVVLNHHVSLQIVDGKTMLSVTNGLTSVEIPQSCVDSLTLIVHQLNLYQSTAKALQELPKSPIVNEDFRFFVALTSYLASVVAAFQRELDNAGNTQKWRSAHLDFHIALALQDNAFTKEQQAIALKTMKRTWNNFRDKKPYKKVQDITGAALHKRFCLNGDNLCGGPFEHTRKPSDLVAGVIEATTLQSQPEVAIKQEKTVRFRSPNRTLSVEIMGRAAQTATGGSSSKAPRGKMVKATAQSVTNSQPAPESMVVNLDDIENPQQERDTSVQSKNVVKLTIRRSTSQRVGSSLPRPSILGSDEEESHSEQVASLFESKEAPKKTTKSRKASQKGKRATRKGKTKATSFPVESEDERDETSHHSPDIQSNAKAEEIHAGKRRGARRMIHSDEEEDDALEITANESGNTPALFPDVIEYYEEAPVSQPHEVSDIEMSQDSPDELDDTILPPGLENWENWNKVAFQSGNSKIFLKLGAWMLLRFRQLAVLPVDADVNGLVIPQSPRGMSFDNEDDFYEALGMERLYSAVAHIDTRPRYMRHLLHSLGRSVASADSEIGKTHDLAASSPPAVTLSMMSDMTLPWISLANDMHDEIPVDDAEEQGKVIHAMEDMAIDSDGVPVDDTVPDMSRPEFKRKRTSSHASPPKKDSGRGPSKRPKEAIAIRLILTPPVITSTVLGPSTGVAPPIILVPATQDPQGSNFEIVNNGNSNIYDDDADAVGDLVEDEELFPSPPPDPPSVAESGAAIELSSITADSDHWLEKIVSPSG